MSTKFNKKNVERWLRRQKKFNDLVVVSVFQFGGMHFEPRSWSKLEELLSTDRVEIQKYHDDMKSANEIIKAKFPELKIKKVLAEIHDGGDIEMKEING